MDLIVTDIDGTLLGDPTDDDFALLNTFRERLLEHRKKHNTVWAVCTGRPLPSFKQCMLAMSNLGIIPDYAIVRHSEIYELTRFGYIPHILWNNSIRWQVRAQQRRLTKAIQSWHSLIFSTIRRVRVTHNEHSNLRMRFDREEDVKAAMTLLEPLVRQHMNLQLFRYKFEIDIRPIPFTKGLAVSDLFHHLGIGPESVLTIGNGYNDLSMFDAHVARQVGCPANAEPEVIQTIHRRCGHIARQPALAGVIEIMDSFETASVNSELPAGWADPAQGANPRLWKKPPVKSKPVSLTRFFLVACSGYAALLAMAHCRMLGGFSFLISKPFYMAATAAGRLAAWLGW